MVSWLLSISLNGVLIPREYGHESWMLPYSSFSSSAKKFGHELIKLLCIELQCHLTRVLSLCLHDAPCPDCVRDAVGRIDGSRPIRGLLDSALVLQQDSRRTPMDLRLQHIRVYPLHHHLTRPRSVRAVTLRRRLSGLMNIRVRSRESPA